MNTNHGDCYSDKQWEIKEFSGHVAGNIITRRWWHVSLTVKKILPGLSAITDFPSLYLWTTAICRSNMLVTWAGKTLELWAQLSSERTPGSRGRGARVKGWRRLAQERREIWGALNLKFPSVPATSDSQTISHQPRMSLLTRRMVHRSQQSSLTLHVLGYRNEIPHPQGWNIRG